MRLALPLIVAFLLQVTIPAPRQPVRITSEQASLLRTEAGIVRTRAGAARQTLLSLETRNQFAANRDTLRANLAEATAGVSRISARFVPAANQKSATEIYFGDISRRYAQLQTSVSSLEQPMYTSVRDSVFQMFEQNAVAYEVVAQAGVLTFDLSVASTPPEATVSYRRTGDPYQNNPDPTNTTLKSLEYAIWIIKVQKPGYKDQEKMHDPLRESNHVVYFILEK